MNQFGKLMRAFRQKDGLSSLEMAKRLGTYKGYVSGIETGKTNPPSAKILAKYWEVFKHHGIKLADLVELAYVIKAPELCRARLQADIAKRNPLCQMEVVEIPAKPAEPAQVVIKAKGKKAAV